MDEPILNSIHLSPETLYLPHQEPLTLDPMEDAWVRVSLADQPGPEIIVKKCAYCQRLLPLDPRRPSALAFHKHNAKVTGHQNECRACKKWRINNTLNPKRTTDQLHESSLITRERQMFLREPNIRQRFKDREGGGLKSLIWERFGRRCFRCRRPLRLGEVHLDHTRPLAYLWPIDEHATCLCGECNNHKSDRFPVEVYTDTQLRQLSKITGLAYDELKRREVNRRELARLLKRIGAFARSWDPITFNATARKIKELLPGVDLFEQLRRDDPEAYIEVTTQLAQQRRDDR